MNTHFNTIISLLDVLDFPKLTLRMLKKAKINIKLKARPIIFGFISIKTN